MNNLVYTSWENVHGTDPTSNEHEKQIRKIIYRYDRQTWIKLIHSIAVDPSWHEFDIKWRDIQKRYLNITQFVILHRRGLLLLVQYVYSSVETSFRNTSKPLTAITLRKLFLRINSILNKSERGRAYFGILARKRIFFHYAKTVQTSFTYGDLKAIAMHFENMHHHFTNLSHFTAHDQAFKAKFGLSLDKFITALKLACNGQSTNDILSIARKVGTINIEDIESEWNRRKPTLPIPLEYKFIYSNSTIEIDGDLYTVDWLFLIESLIKAAYDFLIRLDKNLKQDFGLVVFEPALKDYLRDIFIDGIDIREIKVGSKKYEYGDFGIIRDDTIYLFEIKSTELNLKSRFSINLNWFYNELDDKLVQRNGVTQQVEKLEKIDEDLKKFCDLASIPKKKYKIVPVLLVYDEFLQASGANWYFNYRFSRRIRNLKEITLTKCYSVITFNELYFLSQISTSKSTRLDTLLDYSNRDENDFNSFRIFCS